MLEPAGPIISVDEVVNASPYPIAPSSKVAKWLEDYVLMSLEQARMGVGTHTHPVMFKVTESSASPFRLGSSRYSGQVTEDQMNIAEMRR
jgi:hypothetical protein